MRIICLDVGTARIGVAVSDPDETTALPLLVIERCDPASDIRSIVDIIEEYGAEKVIFGMPLSLDGDKGPQAVSTSDFAKELRQKTKAAVIPQDERYSTREAERVLIAQGVKRDQRRAVVDKVAAAIILQTYLDGQK